MENYVKEIKQTAELLIQKTNSKPEIGIVLGSGLGDLADKIENPQIISYSQIPNFVQSTASGHKGNLIFGTLGGKQIVAMQGRFHYYEGYDMLQVTFPIRVMASMGIHTLFVSNAAGGVNHNYKVGDLMILSDHINMLPNPLIGKNMDPFPRFPDMTRVYDREIIQLAEHIANGDKIHLQKGIYLGGTGPTYETPAEYNFFRTIGADAVGMSTIPEVIVARQMGIRVFGMSVITNEAHHFSDDFVNDHKDVMEAANKAATVMSGLFEKIIKNLPKI